jgi:site-specific recombinase XerD
MFPPAASLEQILQSHIQTLALTLRPSTINGYRGTARCFLAYLRAADPQAQQLSDLRRDPHLLGWRRSLCDRQPPLSNRSRWGHLLLLRRLLDDLEAQGHPVTPRLIRPEDFPPLPCYLPRALSGEDDYRLQEELRRADDWPARALLLVRLTGIRIGECIDLTRNCLRHIGADIWGVHIPLGKLHTERMVPADAAIRDTVARILTLCPGPRSAPAASAQAFLLPRPGTRRTLYETLRSTLAETAQRAACSCPVTPHRLRHTFASEMVRLGLNLPALMQLLGHKDIRMTLRYVLVTQVDLQREFYTARRNAAEPHRIPVLSLPSTPTAATLPGICQALKASRHLLEMYRRQLSDQKTRRTLQRLDHRLLAVAVEVAKLANGEK